MTNPTPQDHSQLERRSFRAEDGSELEYYVYPEAGRAFDRVLVYVHGLVSDHHWFRVPENLPENTGILFLPRQPRVAVDRFETWSENYQRCLEHFQQHHESPYYHLLAQCFGTMPAMHWATVRPNLFDTITIASPPVDLRHPFSLAKKLGILFGRGGGPVHCGLTPRTYGRSPALQRFIEENPTTDWYFTNHFYRQAARLQRWLRRYVITFPAPTHAIVPTEDEVALPIAPHTMAGGREHPSRTTMIVSDHFCELLPTGAGFWREVFDFQLQNESCFEVPGEIRTVLLTGATGFLGSHLLRRLHADGKNVVAYARTPERARQQFADLGERFEVRQGDLHDSEALGAALRGIDAVVHAAGHVTDWDDYESFARTNVEGTANVLLLAHEAGVKQFVHISSLGVFGDIDQDAFDENHMYRLSSDHYSNSKIHAEIFVRRYCSDNRIPYGVVRPGFIYGEGDNNFFPKLIDNLKSGRTKYIGSRDNYVNTVYVGNVAELVGAMVGNPASFGETYNIGDPEPTTLHDFFESVCGALGIDPPTKVVPKAVALIPATILEWIYRTLRMKSPPLLTRKKVTFVARSRSVDAGKAWALIGRQPYSAKEGLERTLAGLES